MARTVQARTSLYRLRCGNDGDGTGALGTRES